MTDLAMGRGGAFDIGRVVERTFGVIGANFLTMVGLALLLSALPQSLAALGAPPRLDGAPDFSPIRLIGSLVAAIGAFVLQSAVVHASIVDLNGGKANFADSLRTGLRHFWPVVAISILMTFAVVFGSFLLLVPGVMMAVAWVVAVPVRVVENKGIFASFSRSAELTRGSRWGIFGLFFVYILLAMLLGLLGGVFVGAIVGITGGANSIGARAVISPIFNALASMVGASGAAAIYYELRSKKEGVAPQELAAVFD